jgi:protein phosphatase
MELPILAAVGVLALVLVGYLALRRREPEKLERVAPAQAAPPSSQALSSPAPKVQAPEPPSTTPSAPSTVAPAPAPPRYKSDPDVEEDDSVHPTKVGKLPNVRESEPDGDEVTIRLEPGVALPIVVDDEAEEDEPTRSAPFFLVSAFARTDQGRKRKRNEDSILVRDELGLYVVADGMGGHAGGQVASKLAVDTIDQAFRTENFGVAPLPDNLPRRGWEVARAIQLANAAIFKAAAEQQLHGMGTTVVAARFSPNKQRLYVGHVGDSRVYRLRDGRLTQMTLDHTMRNLGMEGPVADWLSRAVGIKPTAQVDVLLARPQLGDVYLLCSDGLTKMVPDDRIAALLALHPELPNAVDALVDAANAAGGKDNVSVILVRVVPKKLGSR